MKDKKDIFDLLKALENKASHIQDLFGDNNFLDEEISIIWAMIDDSYGITGMDTDKSANILSSYGLGEISKKKAQSKLRAITQDN